jgi:hypothetical protein
VRGAVRHPAESCLAPRPVPVAPHDENVEPVILRVRGHDVAGVVAIGEHDSDARPHRLVQALPAGKLGEQRLRLLTDPAGFPVLAVALSGSACCTTHSATTWPPSRPATAVATASASAASGEPSKPTRTRRNGPTVLTVSASKLPRVEGTG